MCMAAAVPTDMRNTCTSSPSIIPRCFGVCITYGVTVKLIIIWEKVGYPVLQTRQRITGGVIIGKADKAAKSTATFLMTYSIPLEAFLLQLCISILIIFHTGTY